MYRYVVKFVCGVLKEVPTTIPGIQCSPVLPGAYTTEVNIYNYSNCEPAHITKCLIPIVLNADFNAREPHQQTCMPLPGLKNPAGGQSREDVIDLKPRSATMDDCCRIHELLGPMLAPGQLFIGFLEITSNLELAVTAVYTAADLRSNSLSIDVAQVPGRQY